MLEGDANDVIDRLVVFSDSADEFLGNSKGDEEGVEVWKLEASMCKGFVRGLDSNTGYRFLVVFVGGEVDFGAPWLMTELDLKIFSKQN